MKTLTKYLNERLVIFPSQVDEKLVIFPSQVDEKLVIFPSQVDEKLVINKDYKNPYTCAPKSFKELRKIIEDRYDKLGPGTKQKPIDFNDVDVSNIDSFCDKNNIGIFQRSKFEYIDISDWDVSNVESMFHMFYCCNELKSVGDLSKWNISNVEDMTSMFESCKQLKSVGDLSNWNVSNVRFMYYMFSGSGITNKPKWYKK